MKLNIDKYNKLDKIVLTEEQYAHIMTWDKENHSKFDSIDFPLQECIIEIPMHVDSFQGVEMNKTFISLYYIKIEKDMLYFKHYDKEDMKEVLSFSISQSFSGVFDDIKTMVKGADKELLKQQASIMVVSCLAIFQYMNNKPATIREEKVSRAIRKKGKSGSKSKVTRVNTIRYTIDLDKEGSREYVRRMEAWNVRGHYRHYKSGKVVWIKPTVKGKGKADSKTYKL